MKANYIIEPKPDQDPQRLQMLSEPARWFAIYASAAGATIEVANGGRRLIVGGYSPKELFARPNAVEGLERLWNEALDSGCRVDFTKFDRATSLDPVTHTWTVHNSPTAYHPRMIGDLKDHNFRYPDSGTVDELWRKFSVLHPDVLPWLPAEAEKRETKIICEEVSIQSDTYRLKGKLYRAEEAKGTVILLHGVPGSTTNTDLALAAQEAGWNVLVFSPRGCWGSEGNYRFKTIPRDIKAAIAQVELLDLKEPIVGAGHSMGGWGMFIAASQGARLHKVIPLAGVLHPPSVYSSWSNLNRPGANFSDTDLVANYLPFLVGVHSPEDFREQWRELWWTDSPLDLVSQIASLGGKKEITCPLTLIHPSEDSVSPLEEAERLVRDAGSNAELVVVEGADHGFSKHRHMLKEHFVNALKGVVAPIDFQI